MIRLSANRSTMSLSALLLTLSAVACSSSGENIARSTTNNAPAAANTNVNAPANVPATTTPANAANKAKLNLNTAAGGEFLAAVPNLGKKMAHEFEEYRPYKSIQQFRREMGKYVKPEMIAEYEKYVFVPIVANEADAATLQQIPGLDATEAQALIAARPYASNDAFLAKLTASVSADELAVARSYLGK